MKGFSHFMSGVAVASFCPWSIDAALQGNPLFFVLGGACGILPDTLDFKVYRFFYPGLFLVCAIWFLFSDIGAELINSIPEMYSVFDIPIIVLAGLVVVTLLIGLVAERVYRADVKLYYGGEMTKLKVLISEMENLKT